MIIISAHADTNFKKVELKIDGQNFKGYLDNYVGVYSVMKAFFSGQMSSKDVRVELTYGEETDMEGAKQIAKQVKRDDLVIVVDVTSTPTEKDFVIEKCRSEKVKEFLKRSLEGFSYDIYKDCPDPVSDMDEVEVYKKKTDHYFFLGLPCTGGDYNSDVVSCKIRSVEQTAHALLKICGNFKEFEQIKLQ